MRDLLLTNLIKPLAGRVGTATAAWLLTLGASADLSAQVAAGVVAVGLIAADLTLSWIGRREVVKKTVDTLFERQS